SLGTAATSASDSVRLPALQALARFGGPKQQDAAASVLADKAAPAEVRSAAASALGGIAQRANDPLDEAARRALHGALEDADPTVRAAAANAIGRVPGIDPAERAKWLETKGVKLTTGAASGTE
ncbi:MAG TPA: HEAT repeat domain-containing protein, partial [Planctomycetota bacterium]|nr:HEAT repeat domain-containing protein [Planctomycetota bacterium]